MCKKTTRGKPSEMPSKYPFTIADQARIQLSIRMQFALTALTQLEHNQMGKLGKGLDLSFHGVRYAWLIDSSSDLCYYEQQESRKTLNQNG